MKKVKDKYFVWHVANGWVEVNGEPVVMPGFEEYDLFFHCAIDELGFSVMESFTVSEGKSGFRVSKIGSREEAIERATKLFTDHGKEQVERAIGEAIEKSGLSPRWSTED